jgi:hypothetical protein
MISIENQDIITSIVVSPIGNEPKVYYNKQNLFLLHVLQENDLSLRQLDLTAVFKRYLKVLWFFLMVYPILMQTIFLIRLY